MVTRQLPFPLFVLGTVIATPGATERTTELQRHTFLTRHANCDWGVIVSADADANDLAIAKGCGRLVSAYAIDESQPCPGYGSNALWIITEADRSVTTFLLPSEY